MTLQTSAAAGPLVLTADSKPYLPLEIDSEEGGPFPSVLGLDKFPDVF